MTSIMRDQKIPVIAFVANTGGLLGLCMGFSFVSVFEILFHLLGAIKKVWRKKLVTAMRGDGRGRLVTSTAQVAANCTGRPVDGASEVSSLQTASNNQVTNGRRPTLNGGLSLNSRRTKAESFDRDCLILRTSVSLDNLRSVRNDRQRSLMNSADEEMLHERLL